VRLSQSGRTLGPILARDGATTECQQRRNETAGNDVEGQILEQRQAKRRDQHQSRVPVGEQGRSVRLFVQSARKAYDVSRESDMNWCRGHDGRITEQTSRRGLLYESITATIYEIVHKKAFNRDRES
jgi:hypothetical protein